MYLCKIGTFDGRVVEKEFEAASRDLLKESLEAQGFFVFRLRRVPLRSIFPRSTSKCGINGKRFLSFNQEFLVLLRSGLPIVQILDTLIENMESGALRDALGAIRSDIKGGSLISEAFARFPRAFPPLYLASIRAGERTGELPLTLARYIAYLRRIEALRAKVRSASFYPMLLTIAVIAVLLFLMLYVVPSFTQIYADASVQLPLLTRVLIATAEGMVQVLPLLIILTALAAAGGGAFLRSEKGAYLLDRFKLALPFFGNLFLDYALSGYCRTFGTTLASGIPAVQAMQMSRGTLNNRILEKGVARAIREVEAGAKISEALEQTAFFPGIALRMISAGETAGALSEMLGDVAEYYEEEVERRLDRLTTLIEPLMMVSMGLLIGGIVVAMYIPIFQLAGTVH